MAVENLKSNTDLSIKSGSLKQFSPIASATSLLSEAVYYIDGQTGTNYIPTTASGYMYLPGVSANYASAPDSAPLSVTGDIDIQVKVALDNWIPSTDMDIVSKWTTTGNQRSYALGVLTTGLLRLTWSANGTATITSSSTVIPGLANGSVKWIRATLDVDNGASGNDVKFYTSDNGTSWTQLGSTVTTASTTSIYDSTALLNIGGSAAGTLNFTRAKIYQARIYSDLTTTTKVFDANFETAMTSQTVASFTESSTNAATVTVNRTTYNFQLDTIANLGTAGSLLPTTLGSSTAADSNDPKFLDFTGTNYVYLPGVAINYLSVPDAAALDITGDIDIRAQVALDDWTPGALTSLVGKYNAAGSYSYWFGVATSGVLQFYWSADGTNLIQKSSTVAPTITDGSTLWVRATLDIDNSASGNDVKFFTSTDGTTWTQLGTTVTTAGVTSIFASTANVTVGSIANGTFMATGKIYRAQIFNGIDGTKVLDVDTSVITAGSATSFTAVTGQTVTINRSTSGRKSVAVTQPTWLFGTDDYMEVNNRYMASGTYLYLPGVSGNNARTNDSAALDVTGDIDLRVKVALDQWSGINQTVLARQQDNTRRTYWLGVSSSGVLRLDWSTDGTGTNQRAEVSTVATGIPNGSTKWIRATLDVDNGAGGYDVKFYTSDDGTTWTQLGNTVTTSGTTSIANTSSQLEIGSRSAGTVEICRGKFFRAQVLNGIDGTVAFDANFETSITSLLQTSFTESSANAATVDINRSGSAYRSAGITAAGYLYPGATNTFSASATDYLNFGAADSFTFMSVMRIWNTPVNYANYFGKIDGVTPFVGYSLNNDAQALRIYATLDDGPNGMGNTVTYTNGQFLVATGVINRSTQIGTTYLNTTASTPNSISSIGSPSNIYPFRIGRPGSGSANIGDFEFLGGAVFRRRLLAPEIAAITAYFSARSA